MITLEQAKHELKIGQILYHIRDTNRDGSPQRWKINGKAHNWVRKPERVEVPLKYGLYNYAYLTERHLDDFCLTEEEALHNDSEQESRDGLNDMLENVDGG